MNTENEIIEAEYQALIRIDASVNQRVGNNYWHPAAVFNDSFFVVLNGKSENDVIEELKNKLDNLKKAWEEVGGKVGVIEDINKHG